MTKPSDEPAARDTISALPAFSDIAARPHGAIFAASPEPKARPWYGEPEYAASAKRPVLCFLRVDDDRSVTFGLTEHAHHEPEPDIMRRVVA